MARDSYLFPGILGTTGSGKSTILSLILRLYEPSSGQILLDGRDIKEYNPLWLRYHIGFVSQDDATISFFFKVMSINCLAMFSWHLCFSQVTSLMISRDHGQRYSACNGEDLVLCNRTIRENLLYGCDTEPNDADARQALRAAQCEDGWYKVGVFLVGHVSFLLGFWFSWTCNLWFFGFGSCCFLEGKRIRDSTSSSCPSW